MKTMGWMSRTQSFSAISPQIWERTKTNRCPFVIRSRLYLANSKLKWSGAEKSLLLILGDGEAPWRFSTQRLKLKDHRLITITLNDLSLVLCSFSRVLQNSVYTAREWPPWFTPALGWSPCFAPEFFSQSLIRASPFVRKNCILQGCFGW